MRCGGKWTFDDPGKMTRKKEGGPATGETQDFKTQDARPEVGDVRKRRADWQSASVTESERLAHTKARRHKGLGKPPRVCSRIQEAGVPSPLTPQTSHDPLPAPPIPQTAGPETPPFPLRGRRQTIRHKTQDLSSRTRGRRMRSPVVPTGSRPKRPTTIFPLRTPATPLGRRPRILYSAATPQKMEGIVPSISQICSICKNPPLTPRAARSGRFPTRADRTCSGLP